MRIKPLKVAHFKEQSIQFYSIHVLKTKVRALLDSFQTTKKLSSETVLPKGIKLYVTCDIFDLIRSVSYIILCFVSVIY